MLESWSILYDSGHISADKNRSDLVRIMQMRQQINSSFTVRKKMKEFLHLFLNSAVSDQNEFVYFSRELLVCMEKILFSTVGEAQMMIISVVAASSQFISS